MNIFQVIINFHFNIEKCFLRKISENTRKSLSQYLSAKNSQKHKIDVKQHSKPFMTVVWPDTVSLMCYPLCLYGSFLYHLSYQKLNLQKMFVCLFAHSVLPFFGCLNNFTGEQTKISYSCTPPKTESLAQKRMSPA